MSASETSEGFTCQYCQKSYVNKKSHTRHEEKCPSREVVECNQRIAELEEELADLQCKKAEEKEWLIQKILNTRKNFGDLHDILEAKKTIIREQSATIKKLREEHPVIFRSGLTLVDFINDIIADRGKSVVEEEDEE